MQSKYFTFTMFKKLIDKFINNILNITYVFSNF